MIFLYKLTDRDKVEDFDLKKIVGLLGANEMYAFDSLDAQSFWDSEILNFKEKQEGFFIIFDSETGIISEMRLGFAVEVIEEKQLYVVKTESISK